MKKTIFTLAVNFLFLSLSCYSQHLWPPVGTQPSPYTSGMKLPGNRYLASTNTYNLVFADQLIPDNLTSQQISFVAKNYIGSQKIWASQAAQYRTINPNFIVVSYHVSNGINPEHNGDCPPPNGGGGNGNIGVVTPPHQYTSEWDTYFLPWLAKRNISQKSARYEQMFQHYTQVDSSHRVWHGDPQWTMNLSNTDWQNYLTDTTLAWMSGNENEGMFFDVAVGVESENGLYHPGAGDAAPYNFSWDQPPYGPVGATINNLSDIATWQNAQYVSYYQAIYKAYHSPSVDYLIIPNVDQMATGWFDDTWLDGDSNGQTVDGAFIENFGGYADAGDMYLTLSRIVKHVTGPGKILEIQPYDTTQAQRYRRTAMYMLVKNQNSYICISDGSPSWWPEYEINLGAQSQVPTDISSLIVPGSGSGSSAVFQRNYQYGMVLCNLTGSAYNYTLTGNNWYVVNTSGGGHIDPTTGNLAKQSITFTPAGSKVSVPSAGCVILTNNTTTAIAETNKRQEIKCYPNPVFDHVMLETPFAESSCTIAIRNIYGQEFYKSSVVLQEGKTEVTGLNLAAGIYFLTATSGKDTFIQRLVVVK